MSVSSLPSTVTSSLPSSPLTTAAVAERSAAARTGRDGRIMDPVQQEEKLLKQFESVMLSMVLKQMRQTGTGEEGLFPGDSSDTLGGMFDMYLGEHLAESGGFGLMDAFRGKLLSGSQTVRPQDAAQQIRQLATEAYRNVSSASE